MGIKETLIQTLKVVVLRRCDCHAPQKNIQVGTGAFEQPTWVAGLPQHLQESAHPG